jgi:hypothetical protein
MIVEQSSLKGWDRLAKVLSQPFRLEVSENQAPRALPWAMLCQPFRLKN